MKSIYIMGIIPIFALILLFWSLYYWSQKLPNIKFSTLVAISTMAINILMIFIMLYTIWSNNKSLQENTSRTISAFQEEISKQIETYNESTEKHINAIKNSTQEYIQSMENFDTESKKALLSGLIIEYEANLRIIKELLEKKSDYTDMSGSKIPMNQFSFEAYAANLGNPTIGDTKLLDGLVRVYTGIKLYQKLVEITSLPGIPRSDRVNAMQKATDLIKKNLHLHEALLLDMRKYLSENY